MRRIAVLDDYQDVARAYADWSTVEGQAQVDIFTDSIAGEDNLVEALGDYEVIVVMRERTPFGRSLIERLPRLELLVTTGPYNAAIDLDAAADRGVPVWATRSLLPPTTELAWALILACSTGVCDLDRKVKAGGWQDKIRGDLYGSRIGVLGLGYYGSEVTRIGKAFGMEAVAWSQNLTPERCAEAGVELVDKRELVETCDVISIHLRLSERTRGLIGEEELRQMKSTAFLVNTSRGPIVDEGALVQALREGWIAGAGLDVFETEPLPQDHALRQLDNVVTTPHVGYVTGSNYRVFFEEVVENLERFLEGAEGKVVGPSPHHEGVFMVPG
jgi:phosphoglycerate dehydrogenase-like enzyme